jgi:hypothetical protein
MYSYRPSGFDVSHFFTLEHSLISSVQIQTKFKLKSMRFSNLIEKNNGALATLRVIRIC